MLKYKEPVFLFAGEEEFLKEQELNRIKSELFKENKTNLNYDFFYGQQADINQILECVNTRPLLSNYRLVVVKNIDGLSSSNKQLLLNYCRKPSKFTCLILETSQKDIKRDNFIAAIAQFAKVFLFKPLGEEDFSYWTKKRLASEGKKISSEAFEALKEKSYSGLSGLVKLLDNIVLYTNGKDEITLQDIEVFSTAYSEEDVFKLTDALGSKQFSRAIELSGGLLEKGKGAFQILGLISWHMKRISQAKEMLKNGVSKGSIKQKLKINSYFFNAFIDQVSNFSQEEIDRGFKILLDTDMSIKSGRLKQNLALELAVLRLCS